MSVTVRDIAREAGVSATTVSLVLGKRDNRISEATRQRITALAKEMNYSPNQIAAALVTKKTNTIGLILPDMTNLFFATAASGIEKYAQQHQYSLLLSNSGESVDKCISYIHVLEKRYIDGIVVVPPSNINSGENYVKMQSALAACTVPYVLLERAVHNVYHDFVTSDNRRGGCLATEYLLGLGHVKIGCITGPLSEYGAVRRRQGYVEALAEHGIDLDEQLIYEGDFHIDSGFDGANVLLDKGVSAIFASNDMMALGVLRAATKRGVVVPEQLSVVGYDNSPLVEMANVPLTTVNQPADQMGRCACEILMRRIQNPNEQNRDHYFSPTLVERASAAPYAGGAK